MTALRDIQSDFLQDIYAGTMRSKAHLKNADETMARLKIYRHNMLFSLAESLANMYPVTQKIVGEDFFLAMAKSYIRDNPQNLGNRNAYGQTFAQFIKSFPPALSLPYLHDVALIEWAYFQSSIATDKQTLDLNSLNALLNENPDLKLSLHPSVYILDQSVNALEIWLEHQKTDIGPLTLSSEKSILAVWRDPSDTVLIKKISPFFKQFLDDIAKGHSLIDAMNNAMTHQGGDEIDIHQEFAQFVTVGLFTTT